MISQCTDQYCIMPSTMLEQSNNAKIQYEHLAKNYHQAKKKILSLTPSFSHTFTCLFMPFIYYI